MKAHRALSRHSAPVDSLPPDLRELDGTAGRAHRARAGAGRGSWRRPPRCGTPGKFGTYLLQLTPAFSPRRHRLEELDTFVEVARRRTGWRSSCATATGSSDEQREATLDWFADRDVAFVGVDAPPGDNFQIMPPIDAVTTREDRLPARPRPQHRGLPDRALGGRALRLAVHGRRAGRDRRPRPHAGREAGEVHVAFNNNRGDDAPTAAQRFRALLGQEVPEPDAPGQLTL